MNKGLGRRRVADSRDALYPMRAMLPRRAPVRTSRYWYDSSYWADQGYTSQCVAYSLVHWLHDSPITHAGATRPIIQQAELYRIAQETDEFPGTGYDGTSVRAGAGVLHTKGFISGYAWAWDLETTIDAVLHKAPVVVGTTWRSGMSNPINGIMKLEGDYEGGHAYVINGCNTKTRLFRIKNSWSQSWGLNGRAYITFDDFETLIKDYGEVALMIENK